MPGINLPTRGLVSQASQSMIQAAHVPRSRFITRKNRLTTFDQGYLVPFLVDEIYPGDLMRYRVAAYLRLDTPLFPMFSNQKVQTFFFFVPNRITWANWVRLMGQQDNPGDSIAYTVPQIVSAAGGFPANGIYDHMGMPTVGQVDAAGTVSVNALPFRAYNRIFNSWFRDENQRNSIAQATSDGPDSVANYALQQISKLHDYFTAALPWAQKFTSPTVPLGGQAWVKGIGFDPAFGGAAGGALANLRESPNVTRNYAEQWPSSAFAIETLGGPAFPQIYADLSSAAGVSINTLRQAFLVQQLLERDARGGTRYTEKVTSHFGVQSPDARLQRPEYIGGGSSPLVMTPIAQTAPGGSGSVGALGGAGTAYGEHAASYAATEHGFILGLIAVRSELAYQQGLPRWASRLVQTDFYFPSLAGLGEQAVLRKEIYCRGIPAEDDLVFGYQARFEELRTMVSDVTGMFKSTTAGTIDAWHLVQRFTAAPVLGSSFIPDSAPMARVLAAGALSVNMQYKADILIERDAVRPVPVFGTPALLGRF